MQPTNLFKAPLQPLQPLQLFPDGAYAEVAVRGTVSDDLEEMQEDTAGPLDPF